MNKDVNAGSEMLSAFFAVLGAGRVAEGLSDAAGVSRGDSGTETEA